MKKLSSKRTSFVLIGLIVGLTVLIFDCKIYASNIIIGAKLEGESTISTTDLTNVFIKNGFFQEKTTALNGLVFRKNALRDRYMVLKIECADFDNTKTIFYEAANAITGISVLFNVHVATNKNELLLQISDILQRLEKLEDNPSFCDKRTVTLKERQPLQGKSAQLLIAVKSYFLKNNDVAYINRSLSQNVLALQDFINATQSKSISGHMCPVDLLCHMSSEAIGILNIILISTEDQKQLKTIIISSENDIEKLGAEILKFKNPKP